MDKLVLSPADGIARTSEETVKVLLHFPGLRGQVRTLTAATTDAWRHTSGEAAAKITFASEAFYYTHTAPFNSQPSVRFWKILNKLVTEHEFERYR
jgi:hypothetical protein